MIKKITQIGMLIFVLAVMAIIFTLPVYAAPASQAALPTPTAQEDGRIIYIAQAGDSWWIISVKTGVAEQTLYELNNTKPEDPVQEGQKILLGVVTPVPVVPGAANVTPTPSILTPAVPGYGEVCVVLFDDVNGDSVRQEGEPQLADGAISLVDRVGKINETGNTSAGLDPVCFADIPEGEYNLSVAVPEGYNPTTSLNAPLKLMAGDRSILNFGAQLSGQAQPVSPSQGGRNPLLAIIGAVLILGGAGVGFYFIRSRS